MCGFESRLLLIEFRTRISFAALSFRGVVFVRPHFVAGDRGPRLAVVQWARQLPDGSIVGVEFLEELFAAALEGRCADELDELPEETTQIRAVPVWTIQDVPGATRTLEEGAVVVMSCVRVLA